MDDNDRIVILCPACAGAGPHKMLGSMSAMTWLRCPHCGMDFTTSEPVIPDEDEEEV